MPGFVKLDWLRTAFIQLYSVHALSQRPLYCISPYSRYSIDTVYSDAAYTLYSAIHSPSALALKLRLPSRLVSDAVERDLEQLHGVYVRHVHCGRERDWDGGDWTNAQAPEYLSLELLITGSAVL